MPGRPGGEFLLHLVPEFEPGPAGDLHLVLLLKDIRKSLGARGRDNA
jgi:hypothetical protein